MKITAEFLEKYREEIKAKTRVVGWGRADGATTDGSVCAAGFGASLMGRAQQLSRYLGDKAAEQERRKPKKGGGALLATKAQRNFATSLGRSLLKNCSKADAIGIIAAAVAKRKKTKLVRHAKKGRS